MQKSLKQMEALHRGLWTWVAESGRREKINWPKWAELEKERFAFSFQKCFACDVAREYRDKFYDNLKKTMGKDCEIIVQNTNRGEILPCGQFFSFCDFCPIGDCVELLKKILSARRDLNNTFGYQEKPEEEKLPEEILEESKVKELALELSKKTFLTYEKVLKNIKVSVKSGSLEEKAGEQNGKEKETSPSGRK
jgi:hypothetical protein